MCIEYRFTFPGCRHMVMTHEPCLDRMAERLRVAKSSSFCCGLFGRPKERKVCKLTSVAVMRNTPCPTCVRTERSGYYRGRRDNPCYYAETKKNGKKSERRDDAYRTQQAPQMPSTAPASSSTPPFLNERQMQDMLHLQETYRKRAADERRREPKSSQQRAPMPPQVYARRQAPSYLNNKPLPPLPLNVTPKQPKPGPPPKRPRRPSQVPQVRYDDEPLPDDGFINIMYKYTR